MDPQVQQKLMIWGAAIPLGAALVVLFALWFVHARRQALAEGDPEQAAVAAHRVGPRFVLPVLLALGFVGANSAQYGGFGLEWSSNNTYRLPHAMILVALLGLIEGIVRLHTLVAFLARTLVYGGAFWILAEGYRSNEAIFGSSWDFWGYAALASMGAALLATVHEESSEKGPGWVDALGWLGVLAASGPVLFFNGYATGPIVLAGVMSVLGAALLVALVVKDVRLSRGGVTTLVGAALIVAIGASVHSEYRSLPAALLLVGAVSSGALVRRGGRVTGYVLTRAAIALLMIGAAGALAYHAHSSAESGSGDEYDPYADYPDE
jgi:hypothetical protein